jgi:putative SOS response-associated peptidase YedK
VCGRLNITEDPLTQLLMEVFGIGHGGHDNPNAAPTESIRVVRATNDLDALDVLPGYRSTALRWWLTPAWSREMSTKYSMFNARSESLRSSRAYAKPFATRRCIVPVSGFYEWSRQGSQKLPHYIKGSGQLGLLLAGLWDAWFDDSTGEEVETFTIVTTAAHPGLKFLHHRQPVMLNPTEAHWWLDMATGLDQLETLFDSNLPQTLEVVPVSTYVNNARNKDERCVQPIAPAFEVKAENVDD